MKAPRNTQVTTRSATGGELERCLREGNRHAVESDCRPVAEVLARVGDKWTVLVVMLLSSGPKRFNELRRLVGGISQRMLTLTLRGLERDGLVTRAVEPTIPPRVEYDLTKTGRTLIDAVVALADWAKAHSGYIEKARQSYDAKHRKTASV